VNPALSVLRIEHREDAPGIAHVILNRPAKGNAMGPAFWDELPRCFHALDRDPEVRAIILSVAGKAFSYGLDLQGMMGELASLVMGPNNLALQRTQLRDRIVELQASFNAIEDCRKPVIAAVHGMCLGGGMDMIAACDIRLCSADALFSVRETRIAIVADVGSLHRLPPIIGEGHTRELAFPGRDINAARAEKIGLVNDVYPDHDSLLDAAWSLARDIARNPPLTVQGTKEVLNHGRDHSVEDGLRFVATWNAAFMQSNDLAEAFTAFAQGRDPSFNGE